MTVLVHDIRKASLSQPIDVQLKRMLNPQNGGRKKFPTLLLYDEEGLKLYEELTYLDEYYLLAAEFDALTRHANALAGQVQAGSILLELGSGNLRKVKVLLDAFERAEKRVSYYALDLSLPELHRTLGAIEGQYSYIQCAGLLGTYEDGTSWLNAEDQATAKCVLWLGSSIGNYERAEAADFLRTFSRTLSHRDLMVVGLDACQDNEKVLRAYNDPAGTTHRFILNGLHHANRLLGEKVFDTKHFAVEGRYDESTSRYLDLVGHDLGGITTDLHWQTSSVFVLVRLDPSPTDKGHMIIAAVLFQGPVPPLLVFTIELSAFDISSVPIQGNNRLMFPKMNSDKDVVTTDFNILAGEKVQIEESNKYSHQESKKLWSAAGLAAIQVYSNAGNDYHLHVLQKPSSKLDYVQKPVPSFTEFEQLWVAWDQVSQGMLPREELLSKPIKLRNACIFYLGHLPTFLDIHLTRASEGQPTSPASYHRIFERGIDPDVENPEQCHAHSEIPEEWPPLSDVLNYQDRIRSRVRSLYDVEGHVKNRKIGRALWLAFEHEAMHLETFLYMLLQSDKALPPDSFKPDFEALSLRALEHEGHDEWVKIPETHLHRGLDDEENDEGPDRYFGWDNEKPKRKISVASFETKPKPLTNGEYAAFLENTGRLEVPASWTTINSHDKLDKANNTNGTSANGTSNSLNGHHAVDASHFVEGKYIKTFYGAVPLRLALDWPVMASYDELATCAKYYDGRIPTVEEVESIYHHAANLKTNKADSGILARKISAVNGHLSNNGVEISPPEKNSVADANGVGSKLSPRELFVDLDDCNIGFKNFHPLPVHLNGSHLSGRGDFGGAWELTSTVLERHEGFVDGKLYPAYTADFFDGKHNVVLGGSWATHPRIAGRKSFINWYQHNYPYAFVGARVVRDIQSRV